MSAMSDYLEVQLRAHLFRTATFAKPTTIRVALCTAAPTDASIGSTLSEVPNSNAYARTGPNPADANWSAPNDTGGLTDNVAAITFPTATGSWGTITHAAVVDSATHLAGNVWFWGALTASKAIAINDIFEFAAGALDITFA